LWYTILAAPFHLFEAIANICILFGRYPGDNPGIMFVYVVANVFVNVCSLYYQQFIIPLAISMVKISKDSSAVLDEATRKPKWCNSETLYLPALVSIQAASFAMGFNLDMGIKHMLIFATGFLPLVPIVVAGGKTYRSIKLISKTLKETKTTNFAQEIKQNEAVLRVDELAKAIVGSWVLVGFRCTLMCLWPYFRTRMIYVIPLTMPGLSIGLVKRSLAFSSSAKTFNSNDSLELFLFIVNDPVSYDLFLKFLQSEYSAENLKFWRRVEEYRGLEIDDKRDTIGGAESLKLSAAKAIYLDFVDPNSVQTVNVSSSVREHVTDWYKCVLSTDPKLFNGAVDPEVLSTIFKDSQREIFDLIRTDPLVRFQKTSDCQKIKNQFESIYIFGSGTDKKGDSKDSKGSLGSENTYHESLNVSQVPLTSSRINLNLPPSPSLENLQADRSPISISVPFITPAGSSSCLQFNLSPEKDKDSDKEELEFTGTNLNLGDETSINKLLSDEGDGPRQEFYGLEHI